MFQNHLQRIPHRIKKVSCRYLKYFWKKIGTKGFLVCALYIRLVQSPSLRSGKKWLQIITKNLNNYFFRI